MAGSRTPEGSVGLGVLLALGAASAGWAQAPTLRDDRLYVSPAYFGTPSRLVGLAGAYVAVAEGVDGMSTSVASIAHRAPDSRLGFAFEPLFSASLPNWRDRDNDGHEDGDLRTVLLVAGGRLQIHKFAVGLFFRGENFRFCLREGPGGCEHAIQLEQLDALLGAGLTLWRDQLVLGGGLYRVSAGVDFLDVVPDGQGGFEDRYRSEANGLGSGFQASALVRPNGQPFRVGASFRSSVESGIRVEQGTAADFDDRPIYAGIVAPAIASAGVAWSFGQGSENLNRLSPWAVREYDGITFSQAQAMELIPEDDVGRLLLSAQLDLTFPVARAAGARMMVHDLPSEPVGDRLQLAPRVGVEHLTVVHRLRLRAGSWLEPSAFRTAGPRPHLTGGADLRLFRLGADWTLTAHFDVASGYQVYGLSIGFW